MASMVDRKYCSKEEKYHCVQTQIGNYTELCVKPIYIEKGYHPEYSEFGKRLYQRECSHDYFQENGMWSDEFKTVTCSMMKSSCDGEGEYRCHNGSPTSNRECGCNHTAGYRVQQFYAEYLKQTCFNPLYQHGDCIYLPCEKKHEELNEVYECVPKRGYNSPPPTKPTSETSSVPALMTKDLDKTGISVAKQPLKDHSIDVLYIAVPLSCVGVLLIVIVGLYFICRGKPLCSGNDIKCCINIQGGDIQFGEKNTMENNMQLEPLLPADDDHNERNEQHTPVHIDHSVLPSPSSEDETLQSMKKTIGLFTERIRPEFHIPPDIDKYLTPSHGLYFSLLYLLKIYYREKFSSIRSAFEFYKKISLYLDLNEFPKLTLHGFAYKSAENEKFACEKIVREISNKYQVPITVISVLDSDNIQKIPCFISHLSNQSNTAMPCIYLGCLENEAKSFFFVPLITSSSDTEADDSSLDFSNIGECLKKEEDNVNNYSMYMNLLKANVSDSIAFIRVTGSGTGSGYRVGPRYVVTALHVLKNVFRNIWETIFQELKRNDEEMLRSPDFPIKIKLNKWEEYQQNSDFDISVFVQGGVWPLDYLKVENVTKYLKDKNKHELADKIEKQAKSIISDCQVEFGKIDTEQGKSCRIHFDMAYGNSEEDIAILELEEDTDKIPFRFLMLSRKSKISKVHVLGHPDGKVLHFDPFCSIVENDEELSNLQTDAIDFFTSSKFTPALNKNMQEDVKKEYQEMKLRHKDMFMQCSQSFAKGSSGGPCLIYDETHKSPVVVGTILRGIPYIYFNGFNKKQQEKSKQQPRFLLDKALTSWELYELLAKVPELRDEIYKEKDATTVDSDPIQPPKGPLEIFEIKKGSVKLSWKKVPSNDTIKQYNIQRVECTKQEGSVPLNWEDCGVVPVENISTDDYCCVINDLDEGKEYLFRVFAKNRNNESGLYLQSIDGVIPKDHLPPPSMPIGPLNIEAKSQNSVLLSWQQDRTSCEYHIQMKTQDAEDWLNKGKTKNPPIEITDIDPRMPHLFQIYAQNDGGRSEPLVCDKKFHLKDLYLPPCFQGELQTTQFADKVELKWNTLQEQPLYPVTEYEIFAYHAETKEHLTTVSSEIAAYKTKRLNKGTEYVFSISAKNDIGLGKELKSKEVFIQGVPDPPVRTKDPILEGTSIDIGWGAPVDNGGSPVTEYVVYSQCLNLGADRYQKEGTSWEEITTLDANTLRFVYENFQIPSKCMLQIIAKNVVGESYPLELGPVDVIQKGIPGPPVWTKHPVVKGGTLEIEWGPPSDDGGSPIEEYVVYMMKLDEDFQEEEAIGLIEWEEKARCNSETLKWNTNNIKTSFKFKLKVVAKTSMGESEPLHLEPVDI